MFQPAEPEADILANTHDFQANVRSEHTTSVLNRAVFVLALGRHGNYNPAVETYRARFAEQRLPTPLSGKARASTLAFPPLPFLNVHSCIV